MQTQLKSMAAELHDLHRAIDLVQRSGNYGGEKLRRAFVVRQRVSRAKGKELPFLSHATLMSCC